MNIEIELREHWGTVYTPLGDYKVKHPQWIVVAVNRDSQDEIHIGYLGTHENAPFNGSLQLGAMPKTLQEEIITAVEKKVGRSLRSMVPPDYSTQEDVDGDDEETELEDE